MDKTYSVYEAKARFSEMLRQVREGATVRISYHGEPVAELRPIEAEDDGLEGRIRRLTESGVIVPARGSWEGFKPIAKRPGALDRFLQDRGE